MSTHVTARSSKHPLGGISRDWRRRLLRFHIPLALVSLLFLGVFLTLPRFDASAYPGLDMHSSGAFPQLRGGGGSMDMDMDMDHEEDQAAGGDDSEHGGQTGPIGDREGHSQGDHGGDEDTPMNADDGHDGDDAEPTGGGH